MCCGGQIQWIWRMGTGGCERYRLSMVERVVEGSERSGFTLKDGNMGMGMGISINNILYHVSIEITKSAPFSKLGYQVSIVSRNQSPTSSIDNTQNVMHPKYP